MLTDLLSATRTLGTRQDDDYIDRLHYFLTSNICIVLSVLVSFKQFNGKPMECIISKRFDDSFEDYAENYCWSERTFYYPFSDASVSTEKSERYKDSIGYYQWVPFFLIFEAACFRVPCILWRILASHSGINVHEIVELASTSENVEPEVRDRNLNSLTKHLQSALRFQRRVANRQVTPHKILLPLNLPYTASFVSVMYVLTKVLYLINVVVQLHFMNTFLQITEGDLIGFEAIKKLVTRSEWEDNAIFPRVTLCDFKVRTVGSNVQDYTVQCVLVINMFNEKIFIFLWCWFLLLIVLTVLSILSWFIITLVPVFSRNFISRHLELSDLPFDPQSSAKDVERFVAGYLKIDGIFILRMIKSHAGIIFASDLVLSLWLVFYGLEDSFKKQVPSYLTPTPPVYPSAPPLDEITLRKRPLKAVGRSHTDDPLAIALAKKQGKIDRAEENGSQKPPPRRSQSETVSAKSPRKLDTPSLESVKDLVTEDDVSSDTEQPQEQKKKEAALRGQNTAV